MCPFGMIRVPASGEYFGRFKGGYEAKAGSLAGYRSRGNNFFVYVCVSGFQDKTGGDFGDLGQKLSETSVRDPVEVKGGFH